MDITQNFVAFSEYMNFTKSVYVPIAMCYALEPKRDVQQSQTFCISNMLEIKKIRHSL